MSDILLQKSEENIKAASYLSKTKKYIGAIVHCSYFSSFQIIKYILFNKLKINETDVTNTIEEFHKRNSQSNSNSRKTVGIHKVYIHLLISKLDDSDKRKIWDVTNNINELKSLRTSYDYFEDAINNQDAWRSIFLAKQLNDNLKSIFKITI